MGESVLPSSNCSQRYSHKSAPWLSVNIAETWWLICIYKINSKDIHTYLTDTVQIAGSIGGYGLCLRARSRDYGISTSNLPPSQIRCLNNSGFLLHNRYRHPNNILPNRCLMHTDYLIIRNYPLKQLHTYIIPLLLIRSGRPTNTTRPMTSQVVPEEQFSRSILLKVEWDIAEEI